MREAWNKRYTNPFDQRAILSQILSIRIFVPLFVKLLMKKQVPREQIFTEKENLTETLERPVRIAWYKKFDRIL